MSNPESGWSDVSRSMNERAGIVDIRTNAQIRSGWWVEPKSRVPTIFTKDGLLCAFRRVDVEALMNRHYPFIRRGSQKIWYFNKSKDREIAETSHDDDLNPQVICNPQVYWEHYQEK